MLALLFYKLLAMSLVATVIALIILIIRQLFDQQIPPFWKYALWSLVVLSLLLPYKPELSSIPFGQSKKIEQRVENFAEQTRFELENTNEIIVQNSENKAEAELGIKEVKRIPSISPRAFVYQKVLPLLWFVGVLLLSFALLFTRLKMRDKGLTLEESEVQRIDSVLKKCQNDFKIKRAIAYKVQSEIASPAIMGLFKPTILLPTYALEMSDDSLSYVLYHELAHYQRRDLWLNYTLLCLQIIYWFNPLLWLVFKLMRDDIEVLTDEHVLNLIGSDKRKDYAQSLVEVLANANHIAFMPKALCMVDGKKNIERRITMLKLREGFKKHKLMISVLCIAVIASLAGAFLTTSSASKKHDIAIYTLDDWALTLDEAREYIKDKKPVLTDKDITAYNPEMNLLFISDEILSSLPENRLNETNYKGGSLILNGNGLKSSFIIVIDNQPILTGTVERSPHISFMPATAFVRDCTDGLKLYFPDFNNIALLKEYQTATKALEECFSDMNLITDKVFDFAVIGKEKTYVYATEKLWQNRTDYLGDNAKVGAILNNLPFPAGISLDGFSLQTEKEPYSLQLKLKSEGELGLYELKQDAYVYAKNAEVLIDLIGNLTRVDYLNSKDDSVLVSFVADTNSDQEQNNVGIKKQFKRTEKLNEFFDLFENGFQSYSQYDLEFSIAKQILNCLNALTAEPSTSSDPADYIKGNPQAYYQLVLLAKKHKKEIESALLEYKGEVAEKIIEQAIAEQPFLYANGEKIKVNTKGGEKRALTEKELADVTRAFSVMAYSPIDDKRLVNPLANLLTSYYQKPEDINISEMIRYMPNRKLKDDDESLSDTFSDSYKFRELKKLEEFPFKKTEKIDEIPVPIGEILVKDVENLLQNYLGTRFSDLSGVGSKEALYLDEPYHCFYIYTSDFGLADFIAESGEIDGDTITLYSKHAKLVLKHKNQIKRYYIYSYTER